MKIDKIFIVHYDKHVNRKLDLEPNIQKLGITYEFKSEFGRSHPYLPDSKYFDRSNENCNRRSEIFKHGLGMPDPCLGHHTGYRAVTLEHYFIYKSILEDESLKNVLILEDDVCFKDGFYEQFDVYIDSIPQDYDIAYLGHGCGLNLPQNTDKLFGLHPQRKSRCSDSYVINRNSTEQLVNHLLPFYAAIDWELTYVQNLQKMNVYWCTNPLIVQGSQTGIYESSF
tara:strand:+ start:7850 stop:8527 length:678 start_codon:yes stop_codon:yes gene_type:complete